jgi:iron(III) transport system ATP-binding protein
VTAALELRDVSRRFGSQAAVDRVSLRVEDGELLALVGPSGCGKSTLLMLVAGLQRPDAGVIEVGGRPVAGPAAWVPPERREVGVVFQDAALFPHLRVRENVAFGLSRGHGRRSRVEELLALVELTGLGDRYPHELSGGQQQRVALARALAPRPRVVLFDEAFGNLDTNLRCSVREQTVRVLRETGAAGVFVTHDQVEALAVGDRVAVMRDGRLEHVAEPAETFHRPANRFVATFLGEADFLPGQRAGAQVSTEVGPVPTFPADDVAVEVMLRPHEVGFAVEPTGSAVVVAREFRGAAVLYTLRLPSGATVRSLQPHHVLCAVGTAVVLQVEAGHPLTSFPA